VRNLLSTCRHSRLRERGRGQHPVSTPQCGVMKNYIITFRNRVLLAQVVRWQSWMKSPEARPAWPGGRPESRETVPCKRKWRSTCHKGWPDGRDEGRWLGKIVFFFFLIPSKC
jgi:hypothetical protein